MKGEKKGQQKGLRQNRKKKYNNITRKAVPAPREAIMLALIWATTSLYFCASVACGFILATKRGEKKKGIYKKEKEYVRKKRNISERKGIYTKEKKYNERKRKGKDQKVEIILKIDLKKKKKKGYFFTCDMARR